MKLLDNQIKAFMAAISNKCKCDITMDTELSSLKIDHSKDFLITGYFNNQFSLNVTTDEIYQNKTLKDLSNFVYQKMIASQ